MTFFLRWKIRKDDVSMEDMPPVVPEQKEKLCKDCKTPKECGKAGRCLTVRKEWNEADHPRGKTTDESTPGSFAPSGKAGAKGKESGSTRAVSQPQYSPPKGQQAAQAGPKVLRRPMEKPSREADQAVRDSDTPAELLNEQYGPVPSLEEALSEFPEDQVKRANDLLAEADAYILQNGDSLTQSTKSDPVTGKLIAKDAATQARWDRILNAEMANWADFLPPPGQAPTLTFIGGRGGSGKSLFGSGKDNSIGLYDTRTSYVLDPDHIKTQLSGGPVGDYDGNKATIFHEESSYLAGILRDRALAMGINIVVDKTLASDKSGEVTKFQNKGYKVKAAFMHVPLKANFRQVFTRWRDAHYAGKKPRLVPFKYVLESKSNEKNFTKISKMKDVEWYLYSNDVPRGSKPKLMAQGIGDGETIGSGKKRGKK